jgi:hypothetical protein
VSRAALAVTRNIRASSSSQTFRCRASRSRRLCGFPTTNGWPRSDQEALDHRRLQRARQDRVVLIRRAPCGISSDGSGELQSGSMNRLYYGDNLDVLRRHVESVSVDLVYLDPPFNSNASYNVLFAERDGTRAASQIKAFEDTWKWDEEAARAFEQIVEAGVREPPKSGSMSYERDIRIHRRGRRGDARL